MPFRRSLQDLSFLGGKRETQPPPPSTINPTLPLILDDVILRALEPEPMDRYRSAGEFWETIALALQKSILPSEQRPSRPSQPLSQQQTARMSNISPERSTQPKQKRTLQTSQSAQSNQDYFGEKETVVYRFSARKDLPVARSARKGTPRRISRRHLIGAGAGAAAIAAIGGGTVCFSHWMTSTQEIQATSTTSGQQHTPSPPSTTSTTSPRPTQTHATTPISATTSYYIYTGHKRLLSSLSRPPTV